MPVFLQHAHIDRVVGLPQFRQRQAEGKFTRASPVGKPVDPDLFFKPPKSQTLASNPNKSISHSRPPCRVSILSSPQSAFSSVRITPQTPPVVTDFHLSWLAPFFSSGWFAFQKLTGAASKMALPCTCRPPSHLTIRSLPRTSAPLQTIFTLRPKSVLPYGRKV